MFEFNIWANGCFVIFWEIVSKSLESTKSNVGNYPSSFKMDNKRILKCVCVPIVCVCVCVCPLCVWVCFHVLSLLNNQEGGNLMEFLQAQKSCFKHQKISLLYFWILVRVWKGFTRPFCWRKLFSSLETNDLAFKTCLITRALRGLVNFFLRVFSHGIYPFPSQTGFMK